MPVQQRVEGAAARRASDGRRALIVGGTVAGVALLLWPLETLLAGILAGTVALLLEGVTTRTAVLPNRVARERVRQYGPGVAVAMLGTGVVAVALWTIPMAVATLLLALVACVVNAHERWAARRAYGMTTAHAQVDAPPVEPVTPSEAPPAEVPPRQARSRAAAAKRRGASKRAATGRTSKQSPAKRGSTARRRTRQST